MADGYGLGNDTVFMNEHASNLFPVQGSVANLTYAHNGDHPGHSP